MRKILGLLSLSLLMTIHVGFAQNTFSPYTSVGIGDLANVSLASTFGMGELGIGTPNSWTINKLNPANLVYNNLTIFEFGLQGEKREISNDLDKQAGGTGGFRYLSLAFPIKPGKWTSSVGLNPYSSVNYHFLSVKDVQNSTEPATVDSKGVGGLSEFYFSNGIKLYKGLSLGVRASFLFGFVDQTKRTTLDSLGSQNPIYSIENTRYSGFNYGLGLAYSAFYNENKNAVNFGLTYDIGNALNGDRIVRQQSAIVSANSSVIIPGDTIANFSDAFELPTKIGFGVSWEKANKLLIGLDVSSALWKKSAGFGLDSEEYRKAFSAGVGIEYIPKYNDVNNYFTRIKYRVGFRYEQLPYIMKGHKIDDIGINFGWTMPIRVVSSLNMGFKLGQRGTTSDNLIKERYFKFVIGASISDRWFVRRKYN